MYRLPAGDGVRPSEGESQQCEWDDAATLRGPTSEEQRENILAEVTPQQRQRGLENGREKQHGVVSARRLHWHLGADVSDSVASGAQTQTAEKNGS